MSDIFEQDIDKENEDLSSLEDDNITVESDGHFIFPDELYKLKLEYSNEGIYATIPEGMELKDNDFVIIPTRYGNDLARNLGRAVTPVGIKPADVVEVSRIASADDLNHAKTLLEKEKEAFSIFREKVEQHKLDMKLISVHFLVGEQEQVPGHRFLVFGEFNAAAGTSLQQGCTISLKQVAQFPGILVSTYLRLFLNFGQSCLHRLEVLDLEFNVYHTLVPDRIHASVDVNYISVIETSEHVQNGVGLAYIGQKLVSEALSLARTFHKSG